MTQQPTPIVVLGAGPAGLAAALSLGKRGFDVTVVERNDSVGGNAGSFELEGLNVDFGSHRLHGACEPELLEEIKSLLGDQLIVRPRHGRIYLRGRWVHFPLKPFNLATSLPPSFMLGVAKDSLFKSKSNGSATFATELEKGLGRTICRDFYFPYAEKIWGLAPDQLDAEQARRRVSANSLGKMVYKVLKATPLVQQPMAGKFYYPKNGFGQISQCYYQAALEAGVDVRLGTSVSQLRNSDNRVTAVVVDGADGQQELTSQLVLSTIPLSALVEALASIAPQEVLAAARSLQFRSMILIYLVLDTEQFSEFDAHYFPGADVSITRLSEPKNYGLADVPGTTVLCAELPCSKGDPVWKYDNDQLKDLVVDDVTRVGLRISSPIRRVESRRLPFAYPIYTRDYREHFEQIDIWVASVDGLLTLGRQGLFVHDNTHHTLFMGRAANACISDAGTVDSRRWQEFRQAFEGHVVED